MSERAAPFHCPYCGDEDLRPSETPSERGTGAAWECRACNRAFRLKFLGLLSQGLAAPSPSDGSAGGAP